MKSHDPLSVARDYHDAWTSDDYARADSLLAEQLIVEVPINDYPTKQSFAQALAGFGSLVRDVKLLSVMSAGNEAMLLYDLDADGLGPMRVVEHFTIDDGKITRLRQIHDTTAVRAAGLTTPPHTAAP
jgi:ketosteroid isomerase-like protein